MTADKTTAESFLRWTRPFLLGTMLVFLPLTLVGCEKDGPLEEIGEEIDDAVDEAKDKVEDAVDG